MTSIICISCNPTPLPGSSTEKSTKTSCPVCCAVNPVITGAVPSAVIESPLALFSGRYFTSKVYVSSDTPALKSLLYSQVAPPVLVLLHVSKVSVLPPKVICIWSVVTVSPRNPVINASMVQTSPWALTKP